MNAEDIEPGIVGLRPVAAGLPLLTFSYTDEPTARDQELTQWSCLTGEFPLAGSDPISKAPGESVHNK